jgi:2'-5' RNA ligase
MTFVPRLFFALWPDETTRQALVAHRDALAHESRGRAMRPDTLHLTLAFIGEVADLRVPTLLACGDRVRARQFFLPTDCTGYFAPPRVAWLGSRVPPPDLLALQRALCEQVAGGGFTLEDTPFRPHITLVRNCMVEPSPRNIAPINWHVESFVLVHSTTTPGGPMYRVLKHWALDA